jgi:hypothetical protein
MAKKDDINLDDSGLDDFDFDIPEWNADEEVDSSSRSPIESAVKGSLSGVKRELASPTALRRAMSMAMPDGYGLAADTIENVATDARSLYDKVTGESPEIVRGSKSFGRKAMNLVGNKVLPKKVADRLNSALEQDDLETSIKSSADYRREQEESDLAALAEIFKASTAAGEERAKRDDVENVERKAMDQARFKTNIQVLTAINRSMARLVGYQDKVTARYQQKMLELNYRQYATTRQLTDLMVEATSKQTQLLETIRHNTALPEAVKIRGSEMFGQLARQRLMGKGLNTISNWSQNYTQQLLDNAGGVIRGIIDPISEAKQMTEGTGMNGYQLGGEAVGSMIGSTARDHASMFIAPYLARNKTIAKTGEKLRNTFSGLPQRVNEYAQSETEGTGFKSVMTQMFKSFLPQFSLDSRTGGTPVESLDEIDKFDKIARRSLIEIIPGYLSEIAHWSRVAVTGEKDSEKRVYNVVRGGFTSEKEQLKDVGRQIMSRSERDSLRTAADEFLQTIGGDVMSSKAQRTLKRKLLDELANGRDLVPKRLADPAGYPGEDVGIVDEITSLIIDTFGLDYEGNATDTSPEGIRRGNDIRDQFLRMASMIPASGDRIRILGDVLGKDSLRKLGYIERQGREDRINFDKIWGSVLDEDDESSEAGASQSGPHGDNRGGVRLNSVYGADQIRSDLASRADRADLARSQGDAQRSVGGLERFLGDKSTLITLIRESRDFHSETVELLKGMRLCCGDKPSPTSPSNGSSLYNTTAERLRNLRERAPKRLAQFNARTGEFMDKAQAKAGDVLREAKDMWIEGEDHPRLQEMKLKAGEYRDKATGEVLKRWEDIQGDVVDLKGKTVVRYTELMESGVVANAKGKIYKRAGDVLGRFKGSKAGAMTASAIAAAHAKISSVRDSEPLNEAVDRFGNKLTTVGASAQKAVDKERRLFKPRMKRLMKFFRSDKASADISGELSGKPEEDTVTLLMRSVQLQYETLKQVTPEKLRKGSFQEMFSRRKELADQAKDKVKGKYDDVKGLFGKGGALAGLLDRLGGQGGEDEDGEGGVNIDYTDLGDGSDDKKKRNRNKTKTNRPGKPRGKLGKAWDFAKRWGNKGLDKMGRFGTGLRMGGRLLGGAARLGWGATKLMGKGLGMGWKAAKFVATNPLTRMVAGTAGRIALGAVMGAAGLVSAPVLAGIAVAGTAIAVGAYVYSATRDKLPPLTRLRMVQYGVNPKPESTDVTTMLELEKLFAKYTSVDSEGKAKIDSQSVPFEAVAGILKLNISDESGKPHVERAMNFLRNRFAAVYLAHVSNYYVLTKSLDLTQIDGKVTGKAALEFVSKVALKERPEVFADMVGPLEDGELEMDAGDVEDTVDDVRKEIQKAMEKESKAEGKPKDHSGHDNGAAAAAATGTAAAGAALAKSGGTAKAGTQGGLTGASGGTAALNTGSKTTGAQVMAPIAAAAGGGTMAAAVVATSARIASRDTELDDGKPVRYRTYGLTEMAEAKVAQLSQLEAFCWPMVQYDQNRQAALKSPAEAYAEAERIFSPIGKEAEEVYVWFYRRFLPTFLAFCSSVRARANIDAAEAARRLKPQQLLEVLRETANAKDASGISVWDIEQTPWKGYYLNDEVASVNDALYNLSLKVKDKTLTEPQTASSGRVRGPNGELLEQDPTQVNVPASAKGTDPAQAGSGNTGAKEEGALSSFWSGIKESLGFGDKKAPQQGAVNNQGQSTAVGPATMPTGTPVQHPGGGSGGNINDVPMPKGDGWEANRETLMAAANMVGIDPALAASIAGVESGFRPNAIPYRNPKNPSAGVLSSAASYYQVIKGTWKSLMAKYAGKYGINPNTTQHDPRANALLGLEYIRENIGVINKVKSNVADTDVYLAHFLGPGGARRFLSAPPGDPAINHVGADQARANPAIFYDRSGRPRTVAAVYKDFDDKLKKHRKSDAAQIAQTLKGGAATAVAEGGEGGNAAESVASAPASPGFELADGTMPSMVKPTASAVSPTNSVAEASPSADVSDLTARADARQTQNSTAGLRVAAQTAEVQSSSRALAAANTNGGVEGNLERLVGVNESQLEQLITLVNLIKQGGALPKVSKEQALVAQAGKTTTQSPQINTPKAATRGTVSVARV